MTAGEAFGRTIQLFLVDGTTPRLRKATIHGWTGLTFVAISSTFASLTARAEVDRTRIIILSGPDPDRLGEIRVYIGSANSVRERIKQSAIGREFWETAITVTTSDDDLSKGRAEYLEARQIELTTEAGRVSMDNGTIPDSLRRRRPEADRANMEQFLANLKIILPVIGLDMLKPQPRAASQVGTIDQRTSEEVRFEIRHKTGVDAEAVEEDGEFIVLKSSKALVNTGFAHQSYSGLKQKLVNEDILVPHINEIMAFAKPYSFTNPSAAAAVMLDRNSNGRIEWKVKRSRQSYHEWQHPRTAEEAEHE